MALENCPHVGESLARLSFDSTGNDLERGVGSHLPGHVKHVSYTHRCRERKIVLRRKRVVLSIICGICVFAHGTSPWRILLRILRSIFPPLTMQTTRFPSSAPLRAAASAAAPAPSATVRQRSARIRTAAATSATETTIDPASK